MSSFISYISRNEVEKGKETFKSYLIDEEEEENDDELDKRASAFFQTDLAPHMLPGERLVTEADSVLSFTPFTEKKKGISGKLFVTNFKVCFLTADRSSYEGPSAKRQRNKLIRDTDIPLTNIDAIYQVVSGKRRKLTPGTTVSNITKYLELHCKDFRVHTFGFKFSPKDQNKKLLNAVVHHAYPSKSNLLFAFDYGKSLPKQDYLCETPLYEEVSDWELELNMCKCTKWRVSEVNKSFDMSISLPKLIVVPGVLFNTDLMTASGHYVEGRIPCWCYTHKNGASLVRSADLIPDADTKYQDVMMSAVQMADQRLGKPIVFDLQEQCPSIKDVQQSFEKFKELCLIETKKDFLVQDSSWMSRLDDTEWLHQIRHCLKCAREVADTLHGKKRTVFIKETDGRHYTCLVSSLVQVMLNPKCRTQIGLQALIQREWIAMGYPFQRNGGLVIKEGGEEVPLFLLFLDCVWQILQQFPSAFAVSETYLTTLWDCASSGLFETFLFDSIYQQTRFTSDGRSLRRFRLPPVWDWSRQFNSSDQTIFNNPLYLMKCNVNLKKAIQESKRKVQSSCRKMDRNELYAYMLNNMYSDDMEDEDMNVILPEYAAPVIKLWTQCYVRWQAPAQIIGGGNPSMYLQQCLIVEEIIHLQHQIELLQMKTQRRTVVAPRPQSDLIFSVDMDMPTSTEFLTNTVLSSSFPFSPGPSKEDQQLLLTPISAYLVNSAIDYDYRNSDD
ncbi:myotubularin-related protein 10-B-like isoform X2 [Pecten maximus]|uniref:myotubularin-related protein 10-B-like isoform X2 n=1 Tax=Pecten maximus TaxID=6579 RepID=UPI001458AA55|nr:myotubularin-related protein 10-B-like isoform X2 [Pecten maximus]